MSGIQPSYTEAVVASTVCVCPTEIADPLFGFVPEMRSVREGLGVPLLNVSDVPEAKPPLGTGNHWLREWSMLVVGSGHIVGDGRWPNF
jgi:hypothetical protein